MLEAMGLIDSQQQKTFASYCARIVAAIKGKYMRLAFDIWDEMINGDVFPYGSLFLNVTGDPGTATSARGACRSTWP